MFLLCFKIFISRIIDVSLSSVRTMFIVKCNKTMASFIAFFEIFIWFYAAKEALVTNVSSILIVISYALGYSLGTFIGTYLNEKLVNKMYSLKIILKKLNKKEEKIINNLSYNLINIDDNNKSILFIEVAKKNYKDLLNNIYRLDKKAYIVMHDAKVIKNAK